MLHQLIVLCQIPAAETSSSTCECPTLHGLAAQLGLCSGELFKTSPPVKCLGACKSRLCALWRSKLTVPKLAGIKTGLRSRSQPDPFYFTRPCTIDVAKVSTGQTFSSFASIYRGCNLARFPTAKQPATSKLWAFRSLWADALKAVAGLPEGMVRHPFETTCMRFGPASRSFDCI